MESKKIRFVLMYDFLYEVGGLEKLMAIHANYLKKAGYEVLLLFADIDKEILKHKTFEKLPLQKYGSIKINKLPFANVLLAIMGFNKLKKIINPKDIIISYSFPVNFTIKKFQNKKILYMNHFPNFLYLPFKERIIWANNIQRKIAVLSSIFSGSLLRKIDKKLVKKNILIFENSKFTKKRLDKIYNINGVVSYPPVSNDFKQIKDKKVLEKYNITKDFIFCSGRVIPDKRIDWLIKSFSYIKNKDVLLIISGQVEKKEKNKLINLAHKLNIKDRIKFLGVIPKDDLIRLYGMAKIYAFPAPKEDFGLVPAESISCGTPVIVWNDGAGPTETINDRLSGAYVKPYNLFNFAEKLEESINKKWDREKIIKSSKEFSEEYQKNIFVGEIKKVINI